MRFAKPHKLKMNTFVVVTAAVLLFTHLGEASAVSAATDQYDPRRDPNYTREASETAPINWEAVWGLVREFEARAHANAARPLPSSQFAFPQPWHYVQESFSPGAPPPLSSAAYGAPYGGSSYGYDPWFAGWWETSPRIPWWSLIPFKRDHHRPRPHHEGKGRHHR
jgi:hypothetical protein